MKTKVKKLWMECVNDDMDKKGVIKEMTFSREVWKKKPYCADHK